MPVTIGRHEHKLDAKNRLAIPSRYREALIAEKGTHFTLAVGIDECISLFLPSQWESYLNTLNEGIKSSKNKSTARALKRYIYRTAAEAPVDTQGRILIPPDLKSHAQLKKDVVISGAGDKAEIWDQKRWQEYDRKQAAPSFKKLARDLDI
ncbi:MAG: division/cell wall cluster transcriptional repressor MraZ [Elusimicrobiota bacterium]